MFYTNTCSPVNRTERGEMGDYGMTAHLRVMVLPDRKTEFIDPVEGEDLERLREDFLNLTGRFTGEWVPIRGACRTTGTCATTRSCSSSRRRRSHETGHEKAEPVAPSSTSPTSRTGPKPSSCRSAGLQPPAPRARKRHLKVGGGSVQEAPEHDFPLFAAKAFAASNLPIPGVGARCHLSSRIRASGLGRTPRRRTRSVPVKLAKPRSPNQGWGAALAWGPLSPRLLRP